MNEEDLTRYFDESVDPVETVAALLEPALAELADALYRHLDTPSPAFGARTWYAQVTDELRMRQLTGGADMPSASNDRAPGGTAGSELPAG